MSTDAISITLDRIGTHLGTFAALHNGPQQALGITISRIRKPGPAEYGGVTLRKLFSTKGQDLYPFLQQLNDAVQSTKSASDQLLSIARTSLPPSQQFVSISSEEFSQNKWKATGQAQKRSVSYLNQAKRVKATGYGVTLYVVDGCTAPSDLRAALEKLALSIEDFHSRWKEVRIWLSDYHRHSNHVTASSSNN